MQKIIVLPKTSEVLDYFRPEAECRRQDEIPFLPDDFILLGQWRNGDAYGTRLVERVVVPAIVFFLNGKILAVNRKGHYRIWFGSPITQEDLRKYHDIAALLQRTIKEETVRKDAAYDLIGYCTYKQSYAHPEFLIVYAAGLDKKRLLRDELWISPIEMPRYYFHLDSLSRKLYDFLYETPELVKKFFLF